MSTPITNSSTEQPCTPVSSNCVIWQGPNIPCIDLCTGQSITIAISNLATKLCEIASGTIDVSSLEFNCLVAEGEDDPETLLETLQLLINKACEPLVAPGESTPTPIPLPACLYYTDEDDDLITSLLPDAYSAYLADKICEILTSIASINTQITNLTARVTALEGAILTPPTIPGITITTGCASGPTPGVIRPIEDAFEYFENTYCTLSNVLGSTVSLQASTARQPSDLKDSPQLSDGLGSPMSDLSGWVDIPTTTADTITNLWLTVIDMRAKLAICCGDGNLLCVPMPVTDVTISGVTTTAAMLSWTAPAITTTEFPIEYYIEVYEWSGTAPIGTAVYTTTVTNAFTSINIPGSYDPGLNYIAQVYAVYATCGSSDASNAYGALRLEVAPIVLCLDGFTIETIYLASSADVAALPVDYTHPCPANVGTHTCNGALTEISGNGIYLGESKLNNFDGPLSGGTTPHGTFICGDYDNIPTALNPSHSWHASSRYSKIVITEAQATAISAVTGDSNVTFNIEYAATKYSDGCAAAHADVTWLRLTSPTGVVFYNGCPSGNFATIDVCEPPTP